MKLYVLLCYVFIGVINTSHAQLCNGSLSDPIVNVTFGNSQAMLTGYTTSYEFTLGCPAKGQYTIQNFIFGCGERTAPWYMLAGDHTLDFHGQYMLVNAESTKGIIHQDTATSLCSNTTYQYAAWLANVMQNFACGGTPVLPNLTFTVSTLSGQVLSTFNTGDLPIEDSRVWKHFGLSFTTPAGVSDVVLSLTTNPAYGCGSAFVVDDITFNMCGPKLITTLDGKIQDGKVCADYTNPFILNGTYDVGLNDPVFQWQQSVDTGATWTDIAGATTLIYKIPHRQSGVIIYRLAMAERQNINSLHCRIVSNNIYTEIHPVPVHNSPSSILGCKDKTLQLPQADPSALSVAWSGPNNYFSTNPKSIVPNIQYSDTGVYVLKQGFYFGCTSVDTFNLNVFPSTTISTQMLYTVCEGTAINFAVSGSGTFKWTPSIGLSNDAISNPVLTSHDSLIYKVTVTNSFGCKDSADVMVNVLRNPMADAGPDQEMIIGDSIMLHGYAAGTSINYSWSPLLYMNNTQALNPEISPPQNIQYTLQATSNVSCGVASSKVNITVYKDIYIPNAFTPNNDGINDVFKIIAPRSYNVKTFVIYSRWGEVLFKTRDLSIGWNGSFKGQPQPAGAYVFYFEMKSPRGKIYLRKGIVDLLR